MSKEELIKVLKENFTLKWKKGGAWNSIQLKCGEEVVLETNITHISEDCSSGY